MIEILPLRIMTDVKNTPVERVFHKFLSKYYIFFRLSQYKKILMTRLINKNV